MLAANMNETQMWRSQQSSITDNDDRTYESVDTHFGIFAYDYLPTARLSTWDTNKENHAHPAYANHQHSRLATRPVPEEHT